MYGDEFLPQPSILPQCDLLITHGGNNTVCEGFSLRTADDRAAAVLGPVRQRAAPAETGFGARLPTYDWSEEELVGTVERLLADDGLQRAHARDRRRASGRRPGEVKGADLIERLALTGRPVLR